MTARHHPDRRTATVIGVVLLLAGLALALAAVLASPASADPTWTTYNADDCTITITPSGRSVFQVTIGDEVTVHDLSDHQPITLDVDGLAWSVAVERDTAGGWVTVASGDAISCDGTTTTTEPPTTTTVPPSSTTQPPDTTTTSFIDVCDRMCPEPSTTTRPPRGTTTTTEGDAPVPSSSSPPPPGGTDDTLPVTGPPEDLQGVAVLAGLLLLTGGAAVATSIVGAEWRSRKAGR